VTDEELRRAKDYLKGKMALKMESSYNQAAYFAEQELLLEKTKTPEEELKEIEKVKKNDIIKLAEKIIRPEKLNLAVIGPFEKKEAFERILNLK